MIHEDIQLEAYHNYLYRRRKGAKAISTKQEELDDWVNAINTLKKREADNHYIHCYLKDVTIKE